MVDLDGEWKWHLFRDLLPAHVLLRTVTVKPHLRSTFVDRPGWNGLGGWLSHIFYEANAIADELVKMDTSGHVGGCIFWYPSPGVRDLVLHEVGLLLPICSSLVLSVVVM
ncbi:hypothetical protein V6N13_098626 [Hibiscus sabdariffa]